MVFNPDKTFIIHTRTYFIIKYIKLWNKKWLYKQNIYKTLKLMLFLVKVGVRRLSMSKVQTFEYLIWRRTRHSLPFDMNIKIKCRYMASTRGTKAWYEYVWLKSQNKQSFQQFILILVTYHIVYQPDKRSGRPKKGLGDFLILATVANDSKTIAQFWHKLSCESVCFCHLSCTSK